MCVQAGAQTAETPPDNNTLVLDRLLEKVYRDGGYDFREYKRGTVTRRLQRRLQAAGASNYGEYLSFIEGHPEEYHRLADDLTIKVSDFFRSPHTFRQLARRVLPELVRRQTEGTRTLRVWSTACARGEEPYSLAILLDQCLGERDIDLTIYATDISREAIQQARAGRYSPQDIISLPPAVRERYFLCHGDSYQVRADIKQRVRFAFFDLTSNRLPPFHQIDLILCCNVLIYLQPSLQERVLQMLYEALATPGYLVLGEVETLTSQLRGSMHCLDSKAKIYRKGDSFKEVATDDTAARGS